MPFLHFQGDFVYWEEIGNHEKIKTQLLPKITDDAKKEKYNPFDKSCNFNTSFRKDRDVLEKNKFLNTPEIVENIVMKPLMNMLDSYNKLELSKIGFQRVIIQSGWWNLYDTGDFQEFHNHTSAPLVLNEGLFHCCYSVIYILHDENEKSSISFRRFGPNPHMPGYIDQTFHTSDQDDIKEGTVLVFPSNLLHTVTPCIKPGRITIAYNVYCNFDQ